MKTFIQYLLIGIAIVLLLTRAGCQQPSGEKYVQDLVPMPVRGPDPIPDPEDICLAQAVYSESKRPHEQLAVAWTIRNRVESDRYPDSYCDVVHQPYQYSGMPTSPTTGRAWKDARTIARAVRISDPVLDTCPSATHFWSPNVYVAGKIRWPYWAEGIADCVIRDKGTKNLRFAFYSNVP